MKKEKQAKPKKNPGYGQETAAKQRSEQTTSALFRVPKSEVSKKIKKNPKKGKD